MDLTTITEVVRPSGRESLPEWQDGDAWLGGGTWLFSEPQPKLRRLIDLMLRIEVIRKSHAGRRFFKRVVAEALTANTDQTAENLLGLCVLFPRRIRIRDVVDDEGVHFAVLICGGQFLSPVKKYSGVFETALVHRHRATGECNAAEQTCIVGGMAFRFGEVGVCSIKVPLIPRKLP